ncbi:MAG: DUF169 domain-containing protein [Terriglobia bacterium]
MNFAEITKAITEGLGLARPPIGLAFLVEPPAGIPRYSEAVPSACSFWKMAGASLFYATAEDHYNCPIGAMTQGFKPPADVMEQAMALIGEMGKIRYFDAVEVENVPGVEKPHQVIVYGPLASFGALAPDVAMIICTPFQAMLLSEATGSFAWKGAGKEAHLFGRPACAVIPSALKESAPAASLGCMGARTFAGIAESEMIVAIPAVKLGDLTGASAQILRANSEMRRFYETKRSQFDARPSE